MLYYRYLFWESGGMVDTVDSKSAASTGVRVRVPSLLPTSPRGGIYGSLAQLVEHRTFNPRVAGSIPARPTF